MNEPFVIGVDGTFVISGEPTLRQLESKYILFVLAVCEGNKAKTARRLGIERRTLYRKLARAAEEKST